MKLLHFRLNLQFLTYAVFEGRPPVHLLHARITKTLLIFDLVFEMAAILTRICHKASVSVAVNVQDGDV